jgi:hypothetical protein
MKLFGLAWPDPGKVCATNTVPSVVSPPGPYTFATAQATFPLSVVAQRLCALALGVRQVPRAIASTRTGFTTLKITRFTTLLDTSIPTLALLALVFAKLIGMIDLREAFT